ncbi:unnamed protein product [Larinioides sclopetarius]|uniref:Uncharacterized protein n=1 Tax=Larinioides sclopetarius TaxID=280406 RepID=A0AAV2BZK8_9ARAC
MFIYKKISPKKLQFQVHIVMECDNVEDEVQARLKKRPNFIETLFSKSQSIWTFTKVFLFAIQEDFAHRSLAINIEPRFIPCGEKALKLVASKRKPLDKLCILSFDEMKVKMGCHIIKKISSLDMEVRAPPI